jgi:uncharacterized membrane protein YfcA
VPDIHLSLAAYLVALTAVTFGATVQGTLGFGANLLAVPVVALLEPAAVPATTAIIVFPLAAGMTVAERHHVDWRGVGWLLVGRLPGTVIGVAVVAAVAPATLSVLTGLAVLVAVAVSVARATVPVTRPTTVAAGVASGAMGTATSIGGPPLALLYQHHEGPVLRSTLAVTFGVGTLISLGALALAGEVHGWQVLLALALVPGIGGGLVASRFVARRLDGRWLRPAVLAVAALAAVLAIANGLW